MPCRPQRDDAFAISNRILLKVLHLHSPEHYATREGGIMSNESGNYLKGIVTGLVFGAISALLLAPRRGEEMRQELAQGATKLKDKAGELGGTLGESVGGKLGDLKERGQSILPDTSSQKVDALDESLDIAREAKEEVENQAHDVIESI
jgi:gas vesicle protein